MKEKGSFFTIFLSTDFELLIELTSSPQYESGFDQRPTPMSLTYSVTMDQSHVNTNADDVSSDCNGGKASVKQ
ncbi:hypothetical protein KIN20_005323 [Parelaphostrongylus tenuis]|uniref:Uncharacterized protein n=1 Tax=Parelaphostrongylus tenuis TaxID=148309 RepID=A0AAD5M325_PARTN|nr:hypothetical protein KIN20_005323 [Parelaphostrongylus tenuis]